VIAEPLLVLLLCNFVLIGLLPLCFFRRDGRLNIRWFATGAPFFVMPAVLLLAYFEVLHQPPEIGGLSAPLAIAAVLPSVASVALLAATVASHRVGLALWHQDNDSPVELVTWGPYARIRHPFYTSFLSAFGAALLAFPHPLSIGCFLYAVVALIVAAHREERRLMASAFGRQYGDYRGATGRFLPRLGR